MKGLKVLLQMLVILFGKNVAYEDINTIIVTAGRSQRRSKLK